MTLVFLKLIKPEAEAKAELVQAVQAVQVAQAVPVVLVVPVDASEVNGSKWGEHRWRLHEDLIQYINILNKNYKIKKMNFYQGKIYNIVSFLSSKQIDQ